jgi:hypothetical protein
MLISAAMILVAITLSQVMGRITTGGKQENQYSRKQRNQWLCRYSDLHGFWSPFSALPEPIFS